MLLPLRLVVQLRHLLTVEVDPRQAAVERHMLGAVQDRDLVLEAPPVAVSLDARALRLRPWCRRRAAGRLQARSSHAARRPPTLLRWRLRCGRQRMCPHDTAGWRRVWCGQRTVVHDLWERRHTCRVLDREEVLLGDGWRRLRRRVRVRILVHTLLVLVRWRRWGARFRMVLVRAMGVHGYRLRSVRRLLLHWLVVLHGWWLLRLVILDMHMWLLRQRLRHGPMELRGGGLRVVVLSGWMGWRIRCAVGWPRWRLLGEVHRSGWHLW